MDSSAVYLASSSSSKLSEEGLLDFARRLEGDCRWDAATVQLYSTDASIYQVKPQAVVLPKSLEDCQHTVAFANEYGCSLTGRGGGTSLAGQAVGPGIIVDCSRYFNRIVSIDSTNRLAVVEPGVVVAELNRAVAQYGLMFAPDPATSDHACIGGLVGNNSSGTRSIRWGKTVDSIETLEVVLASGELLSCRHFYTRESLEEAMLEDGVEGRLLKQLVPLIVQNSALIVQRFPKLLRRVSGYNLDALVAGLSSLGYDCSAWEGEQAPEAPIKEGFSLAPLLVGSEGSLGLFGRITVRLVPKPVHTCLIVGEFANLDKALVSNQSLVKMGPSAVELLDRMVLSLGRKQRRLSHAMNFLQGDPEAVLLAEFSGTEVQAEQEAEAALEQLVATTEGSYRLIKDATTIAEVWAVRKAGLPLLLSLPGRRKPIAFIEDTAVVPLRLPEFVRRFRALVEAEGTTAAYYAHASVGCLHIRPLLDLESTEDRSRLRRLSQAIAELVLEFEGSMSGEHGDGRSRSYLNSKQFGPVCYELMEEVAKIFDPHNRMNPGIIVNGPSPTDNLRWSSPQPKQILRSKFSWGEVGSFTEGVERCNGAGICRRSAPGAMCPSFRATGEEEYSPRGRSNLFRDFIYHGSQVGDERWNRLKKSLSGCLECKVCKSECPSSVDVAKMTMEFKHHENKKSGWTRLKIRDRLFAEFPRLLPWLQWVSKLPSPLQKGGLKLQSLVGSWLGITSKRSMPIPQGQSAWVLPVPAVQDPQVAIFGDCFYGHLAPQVIKACFEVLDYWKVTYIMAPRVCCGRTYLSGGFLDKAEAQAWSTWEVLKHYARERIPVIGFEPSCILTFRDELLAWSWIEDLTKEEHDDLVWLSKHCWTFAEYLSQEKRPWPECSQTVTVHRHCHDKTLGSPFAWKELLGQIPGLDWEIPTTTCCGLAGSFGYKAEQAELSAQVAELSFLPTVRQATDDGRVVITDGYSCRSQSRDLAQLRTVHVAEFLADWVLGSVENH